MARNMIKSYTRSVNYLKRLKNDSPLKIYHDREGNMVYFKRGFAESRSENVFEISESAMLWFDPRPVNKYDIELLLKAVSERFGRDIAYKVERLLSNGLVFVSSDSCALMDHALEFFVNGYPLAIVYTDVVKEYVDIVPRDVLASLLAVEGVGSDSGVDVVRSGDLIEKVRLFVEDRWIEFDLLSRRPLESDLCSRVLAMKKRDWFEVYRENVGLVDLMIAKVRRVVEWLEGRLGKKGFLAFSGGKDSVLAASLLVEAGSNFSAVYTHVEFGDPPNVYDYVHAIASKLGFELHVIEHRWNFVSSMLSCFGMPFRGYRWCTSVFKLYPQFRLAKKLYGLEKIVSYTGSRKYETRKRSTKPATYVDVELGIVNHSVPYKFPRLLEYLVLEYRYGVKLFDDYSRGFERLSCIVCPYKSYSELRLSQKLYESEFSRWLPFIEKLCRDISPSSPETVLRKHLWRFGYQLRDLTLSCIDMGIKCRVPTPSYIPLQRIELREATIRAINNAKAMFVSAEIESRGGEFVVSIGSCKARISLDGRVMFSFEDSVEKCLDFMLLIEASINCISCQACSTRCVHNAIELPLKIDASKCRRCFACIRGCPVAWSRVLKRVAKIRGRVSAFKLYSTFKKLRARRYVEKAQELEKKLYSSKLESQPLEIDVSKFMSIVEEHGE